ncbi:DoxX family protein [Streptomyces sp. URMC 129]|uniref:DoxX family protein n=1 Tax=Streptomyces sp. URMC 129 TaxID=3423407 RepID=UPI003F1AD15C
MADPSRRIAPSALAALLGAAGVPHFRAPAYVDPLVPRQLPGDARTWTYVSGAAEPACAVAVALPRPRRAGALASAALFVAVFPGNVKTAKDWFRRDPAFRAFAYARLPLQVPLVRWALKVCREA